MPPGAVCPPHPTQEFKHLFHGRVNVLLSEARANTALRAEMAHARDQGGPRVGPAPPYMHALTPYTHCVRTEFAHRLKRLGWPRGSQDFAARNARTLVAEKIKPFS